jgi:glycosyltransferase involved in cell wall biosynthesis
MKVCFFGDSESIHIKRWCKFFIDLDYKVYLISYSQKCDIENIHFFSLNTSINVKGNNWKTILNVFKLNKILRQIKPDLFHSLYATSYGITGALCFFRPYVITTLGTDILISPKNNILLKYLVSWALKRANWVTAMSNQMKLEIKNLGVADSKITIVPFGIDAEIFNNKKRHVSENEFTIISTRNFEKVYNIPMILHAVALIKKKIPNLKLHLVGSGSMENEIKLLLRKLEIEHLVKYWGKISQSEISRLLNESNLYISTSNSDGNNISLNEAMACGVYCIATDIPANSQWLTDGVNGNLVNCNDELGLAEKILFCYNNYSTLAKKYELINQKIIAERAIWKNNMQIVIDQYKILTTNESS